MYKQKYLKNKNKYLEFNKKFGGNSKYGIIYKEDEIIITNNDNNQKCSIFLEQDNYLNTFFMYKTSICQVKKIVYTESQKKAIKCICYIPITGLYNNNNIDIEEIIIELNDENITKYIFDKTISKYDLLIGSTNVEKNLVNLLKKEFNLNFEYNVLQLSSEEIIIRKNDEEGEYLINSNVESDLNTFFKDETSIYQVINISTSSYNYLKTITCKNYKINKNIYNKNEVNKNEVNIDIIYIELTDKNITKYIFGKTISKKILLNSMKKNKNNFKNILDNISVN